MLFEKHSHMTKLTDYKFIKEAVNLDDFKTVFF